jgi:hypothetical protein
VAGGWWLVAGGRPAAGDTGTALYVLGQHGTVRARAARRCERALNAFDAACVVEDDAFAGGKGRRRHFRTRRGAVYDMVG